MILAGAFSTPTDKESNPMKYFIEFEPSNWALPLFSMNQFNFWGDESRFNNLFIFNAFNSIGFIANSSPFGCTFRVWRHSE